ncbi:MAG: ribosome biogenesis GTP-binding protein YihA/YsxC [candidate division FCPU426 bacterium]
MSFKAVFVKSASGVHQAPVSDLPEIALAGRSNVGKSSFINALCGEEGLARVSKTPGRTRLMHFFNTNADFCLVDLPGYGFAKASKGERDKWRSMVEGFFRGRPNLKLVVSLIDSRHPATKDDLAMHEFLRDCGLNWEPIATKTDKLSGSAKGKNLAALKRQLGLSYTPLGFSAFSGDGRERVIRHLKECAAGYQGNPKG